MSPNVPLDTVSVIGLGYIGLPTAAVLAQAGKTVIGVDVKQANVDAINAGTVPFVEEGLETVVAGVVAQGKLSAQLETPEADAYIVSVPTPFKGDHDADLSYIEAAARGIAPKLSGGELVVLESTAPPGATEHMADVILDGSPRVHARAEPPQLALLLARPRARAPRPHHDRDGRQRPHHRRHDPRSRRAEPRPLRELLPR